MVRKLSPLVGGRLCLDFVNTVSWRGTDAPRDNVATFRELVRWGERAGALTREGARKAMREATKYPHEADSCVIRAHALREALYRILLAWQRGRTPRAEDTALLNASAPPRAGITWRGGTIEWLTNETSPLEAVLWPIAWSASDLLVSGRAGRLKSCASEACGWLFYDESRSKRRRWCSMSDCGNRAKARRFYARSRPMG